MGSVVFVSGGETELTHVDVVCRVGGNDAVRQYLVERKLARRGMGEHLQTIMQAFLSWRFQSQLV